MFTLSQSQATKDKSEERAGKHPISMTLILLKSCRRESVTEMDWGYHEMPQSHQQSPSPLQGPFDTTVLRHPSCCTMPLWNPLHLGLSSITMSPWSLCPWKSLENLHYFQTKAHQLEGRFLQHIFRSPNVYFWRSWNTGIGKRSLWGTIDLPVIKTNSQKFSQSTRSVTKTFVTVQRWSFSSVPWNSCRS